MIELERHTHEERLSISRRICDLILSKYRDNVLAVFVCGSTAKKLDRPYSDLEVIAVVKDGFEIPVRYYLYHGLVIEVDYSQESKMLNGARKVTRSWPIEADQYRNRIVLFERDHWLDKLEKAVEESDKADITDELRFAAVALAEDMETLLNAQLSGDMMGVMLRGRVLAGEAAELVLLLNRQYVTTTSWFWKQAFACEQKPEGFEKNVTISAGFVQASPEEVVEAAKKLYGDVVGMIEARGISIASYELVV